MTPYGEPYPFFFEYFQSSLGCLIQAFACALLPPATPRLFAVLLGDAGTAYHISCKPCCKVSSFFRVTTVGLAKVCSLARILREPRAFLEVVSQGWLAQDF